MTPIIRRRTSVQGYDQGGRRAVVRDARIRLLDPGKLKNAIDWASRPYGTNSFGDKPSTVTGAIGTAVAQQNLRSVLSFCNHRK
jgi:hypothetical protein